MSLRLDILTHPLILDEESLICSVDFLSRLSRRLVRTEACNNVFYVMNFADGSQFTAIIHYSPDPEDCAVIRKDQVRLSTNY